MFKKIIMLVVFVFCVTICSSQNANLNEYKYVIVPSSYDFLKEIDQYQLNSLSKFLFNKYGFTAIMDDEPLPQELINNICLALNADVIKNPGIMKTKLQIQLKNCRREIVFLSKEGMSREKKYKVAYNYALRESFQSFDSLGYKYEPSNNENVVNDNNNQTIVAPIAVASTGVVVNTTEKVVETPAKESNRSTGAITGKTQVLYAQPINNGYQLVDTTPSVVYILVSSGKKDVYAVKGKDATVYKLDDKWVIAETIGGDLQVRPLTIKF